MLVQSKQDFIADAEKRLSKQGEKAKLLNELQISRTSLWRFLKGRKIRKHTLAEIVTELEGENANVEDYIKPL